MNIKLLLGGVMSDDAVAGLGILSKAVYFIEDPAVAIIKNHQVIRVAPGSTILHVYVDGIHAQINVTVV